MKKVSKLEITENYLKLLALFTGGFGRNIAYTGDRKLLGIGSGTVQLLPEAFEKSGVLK